MMRLGESPDATLVTVDVTAGVRVRFKMRVSVALEQRTRYGTSVQGSSLSQWCAGSMAGSGLAASQAGAARNVLPRRLASAQQVVRSRVCVSIGLSFSTSEHASMLASG